MKKAWLYAVEASFLFALMNASAKFLSSSFSVPMVVLFRGVIGVLLTYFFMKRARTRFEVKNWALLVSRGFFGAGSLLLAFLAISSIKLAEASFLAYLAPLFTVALGFVVLGERMPRGFTVPLGLAVAGTLLVVSPWQADLHAYFAALGVLGAVLSASASIAIRQLSKDHNNYTIMLAFLGTATLLPLPFVEWSELRVPTLKEGLVILFLGSVSFLAQYCLTQAYRLERAGVVSTTRYIGILFNIALGFLIWREVPSGESLLGGFLILLGCLRLSQLSRKEESS